MKDRLSEPSTWAGLSVLLTLCGVNVEAAALVGQAAGAVAAAVAVFLSEKSGA